VANLPQSGHIYLHIATTNEQNQQIKGIYDQHQTGAAKGEKYNVFTNSCETIGRQALGGGNVKDAGNLLSIGDPNVDLSIDEARGSRAVSPSSLNPTTSHAY